MSAFGEERGAKILLVNRRLLGMGSSRLPTAGSGTESSIRSSSGDGRAVTFATLVESSRSASVGMREIGNEKRILMFNDDLDRER